MRKSAAWDTARAVLRKENDRVVDDMCAISTIPAPTHAESARGDWIATRFAELGLEPHRDAVGNVVAVSPSADDTPHIAVMSHLDTVFPVDTALDIVREGSRMIGPGISDNARGLAALLALARAFRAADWPARRPIAFVASVGEEGAGDLRGAKHYVACNRDRIAGLIALDGAGATRIINAGVGSRRLRVTFTGQGGHSWSDFGAPNAIHACAAAVAAITGLKLPQIPRTTLSVGRIGGGTSINTIPTESWFEVDLRSEASADLRRLESEVRETLERVRAAASSPETQIGLAIEVFGDRPAGHTPDDDPLVQAALAATRAIGATPELASSSTDANVAMAAGIPAIAIGAGGEAGGTHTTKEWYDDRSGVEGLERALMIVSQVADLP